MQDMKLSDDYADLRRIGRMTDSKAGYCWKWLPTAMIPLPEWYYFKQLVAID